MVVVCFSRGGVSYTKLRIIINGKNIFGKRVMAWKSAVVEDVQF